MQRLLLHMLAGIGAVAIVAALFAARAPSAPPISNPAHGTTAPAAPAPAGGETVIERDGSGQFRLQARVNGEETRFVVDTGADIVALTTDDAERVGIEVAPEDFRPILRTASGSGNGAVVRLDRLELGDEEFRDIDAVVVEGLGVNLLGQSVLRRLGRVEMRGDRMVLEHR